MKKSTELKKLVRHLIETIHRIEMESPMTTEVENDIAAMLSRIETILQVIGLMETLENNKIWTEIEKTAYRRLEDIAQVA